MRVFVSHSPEDKEIVHRIIRRIKEAGHDVFGDSFRLRDGDNIHRRIGNELEKIDVLVLVISKNSFRSKWIQYEFSAIAFRQISRRESRILPVKIDSSDVPSYFASREHIDLSDNFESGLDRLVDALGSIANDSLTVEMLPTRLADDRAGQILKLREALRRGRLTLVCGAGVSVGAGIPAWSDLLIKLLDAMVKKITKNHPINVGQEAVADFQKRHGTSSLILGKYLKNNLGRDFESEVRDALYSSSAKKSKIIDGIVGLSRPQRDGKPLDSIVTFNFDCLIEENLSASSIPNRPIFSEAIKHESNELPVYHVHGYLPRSGKIPTGVDLVFSEDAYHSQFIDPFSWSNLIQLNKLTQNVCLFVGISLTDPNMRRLLDVAWRKNPDKVMSHYIIKKLPKFSDDNVLDELSKLLEEQDANALGLNLIWVDGFDDIPKILNEISDAPVGA
jgi:hypothetical protein